MKERPILFSGEMIRALLSGRKTQTRRVMKPQPEYIKRSVAPQELRGDPKIHPAPYMDSYCSSSKTPANPRGMSAQWCWWDEYNRCGDSFPCPYGQPGDRLWVRETYLIAHVDHLFSIPKTRPDWMDSIGKYLLYGADGDCCQQIPECQCASVGKLPWRPSIHMPRWASRLTLEITGVRVERMQDISEADAAAEGVAWDSAPGMEMKQLRGIGALSVHHATSRNGYRLIWEAINGPGSWESNPWVWVVEFKIVEGGASA